MTILSFNRKINSNYSLFYLKIELLKNGDIKITQFYAILLLLLVEIYYNTDISKIKGDYMKNNLKLFSPIIVLALL
jgi:hypothetical protein